MNYIKAKYMKDGKAIGRAYSFGTDEDAVAGDILVTADGKHVVMVEETVDMNWLYTYGKENIAVVKKEVSQEKAESEEK